MAGNFAYEDAHDGACEDASAGRLDDLLPEVYGELRALAETHMRRERPEHTLQPTALIHEVYLRLNDRGATRWRTRSHFFASASEAIRRILIEHARRHGALKRGGGRRRLAFEDGAAADGGDTVDLVDLDAALTSLAMFDERMARVVELRFFGGLTVEEVADVLGLSKRTIESDWTMARAWLRQRLEG